MRANSHVGPGGAANNCNYAIGVQLVVTKLGWCSHSPHDGSYVRDALRTSGPPRSGAVLCAGGRCPRRRALAGASITPVNSRTMAADSAARRCTSQLLSVRRTRGGLLRTAASALSSSSS